MYRSWWFWLLIVIGISASIWLYTTVQSKKSTVKSTGPISTAKTAPVQVGRIYTINQPVVLSTHTLTATSVTRNWKPENNTSQQPGRDNQFILVNLTISNTGDSPLLISANSFRLEEESGTTRSVIAVSQSNAIIGSTIEPKTKRSGSIVFEAKNGFSTLKLSYNPAITGVAKISISL